MPGPWRRLRRRSRTAWAAWVVFAWALVSGREASAAGGAMHLEYSAPTSCIDATTFRERLAALPASPGGAAVPDDVNVEILERDGMFHGHLVVRHADGTTTSR